MLNHCENVYDSVSLLFSPHLEDEIKINTYEIIPRRNSLKWGDKNYT
jgi:hypothetical protein